ncbi:MAG: amidohydrolase family protein [Verrucomicrobiota bacterium]
MSLHHSHSVSTSRLIRGAFLQATSDTDFEFLIDGIAVLAADGKLLELGLAATVAASHNIDLASLKKFDGLILPALYDMHFHWVQDDVREMPKESLLEWLNKYTFPTEAKFGEKDYATAKAAFFWKRILATGTIGGLCYSSIHEVALEEALEVAPEGFAIGNVLMTMECPDYIQQTEAEAIESVQRSARRFGSRYIASPRFAPTTAPAVMEAAAEAANAAGCFQQTHLGETRAEIEWVLSIYEAVPGYEDVQTYTEIYERAGMLGPKTVFGHCIYLEPSEWQMLADSDSIIASCPTSNAPLELRGIGSGLFDFQTAEAYGVRWGLASDIGGGPYLSMFDVMASFVLQNEAAGVSGATRVKALYRSSTMNAALLGHADCKGKLAVGFDFDAIVVPADPEVLACGDGEQILKSVLGACTDRNDYDGLVLETIIEGQSRFLKEGAVSLLGKV